MARGWESKSIESQQADAGTRKPEGPPPSAADLERRREMHSVSLALTETTAQLQVACRPAHREMLRQRMTALEGMLRDLQALHGRGTS